MVYERDVEGLDASILTKQAVLKYSGHKETFTDPLLIVNLAEKDSEPIKCLIIVKKRI